MAKVEQALSLIQVAGNFKDSVQGLDDLTELVPTLPTDHLATGYAMVKAFEKNFDGLVKAVRDEFIGTQDEEGNYIGDGRLFTESTGEDDKGNPLLELTDGVVLKASKSEKPTFDEEAALNILSENGLLEDGTDTRVDLIDENSMMEFIKILRDKVPTDLQTELVDNLHKALRFYRVANEQKIEALITLKKLPSDTVDKMFKVKTGYSLLVSKNPYKPKAKKK